MIQNFIANRLWALGMRDEAAEVHERAFNRALALIPKGYKGQIMWSEIDNRSFLRLAHGTLLGLMHRRVGKSAMVLAKKLLAWCPNRRRPQGRDEGMPERRGELTGSSPNCVVPSSIDCVSGGGLCGGTSLRRGIAANPYIAEGLTGRTLIAEHR